MKSDSILKSNRSKSESRKNIEIINKSKLKESDSAIDSKL